MPRSRIAFVVPSEIGEISATVARYGGTGPDIPANAYSTLVASALESCQGETIEIQFDNSYSRIACDALCRDLDREGAAYWAILPQDFDPSMDMPVPGRVLFGAGVILAETREVSLPLGFSEPGFDARTLQGAGLTPAQSASVMRSIGGARPVVAVVPRASSERRVAS